MEIAIADVFNGKIPVTNKWGWYNVALVAGDGGTLFARVKYPKGTYSPGPMKAAGLPYGGCGFRLPITPTDSFSLEYALRVPLGFDFVLGGKLPGLCGGLCNTGGSIPNGTDGWSARYMWRDHGDGEVYAYMPSSQIWGTSLIRGTWRFPPDGQWHKIRMDLLLNSVGMSNGMVTVWFDGSMVASVDGLEFRTSSLLMIDKIIFETFFGGNDPTWQSSTDTYIDFGNLTIS